MGERHVLDCECALCFDARVRLDDRAKRLEEAEQECVDLRAKLHAAEQERDEEELKRRNAELDAERAEALLTRCMKALELIAKDGITPQWVVLVAREALSVNPEEGTGESLDPDNPNWCGVCEGGVVHGSCPTHG